MVCLVSMSLDLSVNARGVSIVGVGGMDLAGTSRGIHAYEGTLYS